MLQWCSGTLAGHSHSITHGFPSSLLGASREENKGTLQMFHIYSELTLHVTGFECIGGEQQGQEKSLLVIRIIIHACLVVRACWCFFRPQGVARNVNALVFLGAHFRLRNVSRASSSNDVLRSA